MQIHTMRGLLGVGMLAFAITATQTLVEHPHRAWAQADAPDPTVPDLTSLNVRLSHRAIRAPQHLVKEVVELPHIQAARAKIAPSPQAAILEDNHHNRVLILSASEDGGLQAQVLVDLEFAEAIPFVTACADQRGCAYDRRPMTGGLGCVAICIQQALDPSRQP